MAAFHHSSEQTTGKWVTHNAECSDHMLVVRFQVTRGSVLQSSESNVSRSSGKLFGLWEEQVGRKNRHDYCQQCAIIRHCHTSSCIPRLKGYWAVGQLQGQYCLGFLFATGGLMINGCTYPDVMGGSKFVKGYASWNTHINQCRYM